MLEWAAVSFCRRSSQPRDRTHISCVSLRCQRILYPLSRQGSLVVPGKSAGGGEPRSGPRGGLCPLPHRMKVRPSWCRVQFKGRVLSICKHSSLGNPRMVFQGRLAPNLTGSGGWEVPFFWTPAALPCGCHAGLMGCPILGALGGQGSVSPREPSEPRAEEGSCCPQQMQTLPCRVWEMPRTSVQWAGAS